MLDLHAWSHVIHAAPPDHAGLACMRVHLRGAHESTRSSSNQCASRACCVCHCNALNFTGHPQCCSVPVPSNMPMSFACSTPHQLASSKKMGNARAPPTQHLLCVAKGLAKSTALRRNVGCDFCPFKACRTTPRRWIAPLSHARIAALCCSTPLYSDLHA